jgi:hypothetical protein
VTAPAHDVEAAGGDRAEVGRFRTIRFRPDASHPLEYVRDLIRRDHDRRQLRAALIEGAR